MLVGQDNPQFKDGTAYRQGGPGGPATATTPAGAPGNGLRNLRRWIVEGALAALVLALKLPARRRETL